MTHDEMRMIRRYFINVTLLWAHDKHTTYSLSTIKHWVRAEERTRYSQELRAYA